MDIREACAGRCTVDDDTLTLLSIIILFIYNSMKHLIEIRNAEGVGITLPRRSYCSRKKGKGGVGL